MTDAQGHALQGELWGKKVDVRRVNFPQGFSALRLSVKTKKENAANTGQSFPILADPDGIELSDIDDRYRPRFCTS